MVKTRLACIKHGKCRELAVTTHKAEQLFGIRLIESFAMPYGLSLN
jgi:hypothetical protein